MRMIVRLLKVAGIAASVAALAGCASLGAGDRPASPSASATPTEVRAQLNLRIVDRVRALTESRYYDPALVADRWRADQPRWRAAAASAPDENALYGVLTTMLEPLNDDHAYVQSPAEVRREALGQTARPLLGLRILRRGDGYLVDDVRPGSPADIAGVETGWRVESADGRPYDVGAIRGDGVPVRLVFRDLAGLRRDLTIAPRTVSPPDERRGLAQVGDVWTVGFDSFDLGTADWLFGELRRLPAGEPVVVDLRGNVGGRIVEVERTLGCFLPVGAPIAEMRGRRGRRVTASVLAGCPRSVDGPVAVLVGRRSRSGAEMFAAALQEAGRARVVGARTAGALLSSLQHALPDGGRLTLSEADFVTAAGNRIERFGLAPDLPVAISQADRRAGRDPTLDAAAALLAREAASAAVRGRAPEAPQ